MPLLIFDKIYQKLFVFRKKKKKLVFPGPYIEKNLYILLMLELISGSIIYIFLSSL